MTEQHNISRHHGHDKLNVPLLICTDLQDVYGAKDEKGSGLALGSALAKCQTLLALWRDQRWPVAHLKRLGDVFWLMSDCEPAGLKSCFEPRPGELAFQHALPSAYSSTRFAEYMRCVVPSASFLIGRSLDETILSTVIDGFHRGHRHFLVEDASVCSTGLGATVAFDKDTIVAVASKFGGCIRTDVLVERGCPTAH